MKDLQGHRLFTRVARLGSFSAAARECGLSQPHASKLIADLEASLGARLLSRTTRAVVPTDAGAELLARMEPILIALEEAEASVRESGELRGTLRVGMPASFGSRVVLPRLSVFVDRHPRLRVEVLLEDRFQDVVRDAVDVAVRVGAQPEATGTSKVLGQMRRVIVAAPSYIEQHGAPSKPEDLMTHRIVGGPASASPFAWQFERNGKKVTIAPPPQISINDTTGAVAAVKAGLGIASTTSWSCEEELDAGTLVKLLPAWKLCAIPVHAYFPAGRAARLAARAFVEFLGAEIHLRRR